MPQSSTLTAADLAKKYGGTVSAPARRAVGTPVPPAVGGGVTAADLAARYGGTVLGAPAPSAQTPASDEPTLVSSTPLDAPVTRVTAQGVTDRTPRMGAMPIQGRVREAITGAVDTARQFPPVAAAEAGFNALVKTPASGVMQVGQGLGGLVSAGMSPNPETLANAFSDLSEGAMKIGSPLVLPALAASPLLTATVISAATVASEEAAKGAKRLGWSEPYQRLAANAAALALVGVGGRRIVRGTSAIEAKAGDLGRAVGERIRGKMAVETPAAEVAGALPEPAGLADIPVGQPRLAAPVEPVAPEPVGTWPPTPAPTPAPFSAVQALAQKWGGRVETVPPPEVPAVGTWPPTAAPEPVAPSAELPPIDIRSAEAQAMRESAGRTDLANRVDAAIRSVGMEPPPPYQDQGAVPTVEALAPVPEPAPTTPEPPAPVAPAHPAASALQEASAALARAAEAMSGAPTPTTPVVAPAPSVPQPEPVALETPEPLVSEPLAPPVAAPQPGQVPPDPVPPAAPETPAPEVPEPVAPPEPTLVSSEPLPVREPWEMTRDELVSYSDTTPKSSEPVEDYGDMTEAGLHARSLRVRANQTTPPTFAKHPVGTYGLDSTGELMQLREFDIDDPILRFNEGEPKNQTTRKYADWIADGHEPPPMGGLETEKGTINVTDGHHRRTAIRENGGKTVKVWVSLTQNVPIGKDAAGKDITSPRGLKHRDVVAQALSAGKPVPPAVLAEYPDLAPVAPAKPARTTDAKAEYLAKAMAEGRAAMLRLIHAGGLKVGTGRTDAELAEILWKHWGNRKAQKDVTDAAIREKQVQAGLTRRVAADDIRLDPKTYQFKASDAKGETGRLRHVTSWDSISGAITPVLLHERADGLFFVADGHQRVALAQRLKAAGKTIPPLNAIVLREADGFDAAEVRRIASLANVRQNSASPIDIAKLLRDAPLSPEEEATIPRGNVEGERFRQAQGLAQLSDIAFQAVVNGEIDPIQAQHVGTLVSDPSQQITTIRALAKADLSSGYLAERFVKELLNEGFETTEQADLFGGQVLSHSLAKEKAQVLDAARKMLTSQKSTFGNAIRNHLALESAGNVLDQPTNERKAAEAGRLKDLLEVFADKSGATQHALRAAARQVHARERTPAAAAEDVIAALEDDFKRRPPEAGEAPVR